MKKLFYLMSTLMLLFLASCEKNTPGGGGIDPNDPNEYCWEIKITASYLGYSESEKTYVWGTGSDVKQTMDLTEATYKELEKIGYTYDIKATKTGDSKEKCDEKY